MTFLLAFLTGCLIVAVVFYLFLAVAGWYWLLLPVAGVVAIVYALGES